MKFNLTSHIRCERVNIILADPFYARFMKGRKVKVKTRTGDPRWYPAAVIEVTKRLASRGVDAFKCDKALILAEALYLEPYMRADRH